MKTSRLIGRVLELKVLIEHLLNPYVASMSVTRRQFNFLLVAIPCDGLDNSVADEANITCLTFGFWALSSELRSLPSLSPSGCNHCWDSYGMSSSDNDAKHSMRD
jgi:hypothetical protein